MRGKRIEIAPCAAQAITLCLVLLLAGLGAVIARTFVPNVVLPRLTVPAFAAISLLALALEAAAFGEKRRQWVASFVEAAVAFGVLPLCAGLVADVSAAFRAAALGAVVYLVCEILFHSILDRLASGAVKGNRAVPFLAGLLLWLASQILAGVGL